MRNITILTQECLCLTGLGIGIQKGRGLPGCLEWDGIIIMGSVICVYRVMPRSLDAFERVKKAVQSLKPERLEEEPIAFGLKAIKFTKFIPDSSGELEKLEGKLMGIKDATFEEISVSRSL